MQQRVLHVHDVDELKQCLIDVTLSKASLMTQLISSANVSQSLGMNLCDMKTFSAFNLTAPMHMLFCVSFLLIL